MSKQAIKIPGALPGFLIGYAARLNKIFLTVHLSSIEEAQKRKESAAGGAQQALARRGMGDPPPRNFSFVPRLFTTPSHLQPLRRSLIALPLLSRI